MHRDTLHSLFVIVRRNQVCALNHPLYSPYLAPCNFSLFPKLKLKLKECFFNDISTIKTATTWAVESIPQNELEHVFELDVCKKIRFSIRYWPPSNVEYSTSKTPFFGYRIFDIRSAVRRKSNIRHPKCVRRMSNNRHPKPNRMTDFLHSTGAVYSLQFLIRHYTIYNE